MFTPSIQNQQSIQNIQAKVHEDTTELKNKITNSSSISPKNLEILDKTAEKINSGCEQILSILSLHDVNQPDSFSPAEKLKLGVLNNNVMRNKEFFESILSII